MSKLKILTGICIGAIIVLVTVPFLATWTTSLTNVHLPNIHAVPPPNIKIWSSDFHISPVADAKDVLKVYKAEVVDKSLSGHCRLLNTCQKDLRVIDENNGIELSPCPNHIHRSFYRSYVEDEEFSGTDAVLCTHACSMCEMFMAFGKPLIVIASTRYEIGRLDAVRWNEWNRNLRRIASRDNNVIAANNRYDLEYMKFFTGLKNIEYLPSYCGYVNATYTPSREQILIAPGRGTNPGLVRRLLATAEDHGVPVRQMSDVYPSYEYADLAAHPAFILMPYQISFMLFFELYRMNIPMFAPSPDLLATWHVHRNVLNERTWTSALYHEPSSGSNIFRHPESDSIMMSDPNNDLDYNAVLEWIKLADFYQFPHVTPFSSFEHLMSLLKIVDLKQTSSKMELHNVQQKKDIHQKWSNILIKISNSKNEAQAALPNRTRNFDDALREEYGAILAEGCVGSSDVPSAKPVYTGND